MSGASDHEPGENSLDLAVFREILATFPAGVVIVTAVGDDGVARGLTISAFCSVSADPRLILVCVDNGSNTLPAIRSSGGFTVNVLAAGRDDLAMRFASKRDDKFAEVEVETPKVGHGGPILSADAASYMVCRVHEEVEGGDHAIFLGEPLQAGIHEGHPPLLYHNRKFALLA